MEYYKTNALYDHLRDKQYPNLKFASGNAWQLIYGNKECEPLLLVFIVGVNAQDVEKPLNDSEKEAYNLLKIVSQRAALPIKFIRFASDVEEVDTVEVLNDNSTFDTLTMAELSLLFEKSGLPISNNKTAKYLNDRTSSAYHKWQRASLGAALTVSDIDLWKIDQGGNPVTIFELKRSYFDISKWKPYRDDYNNFRLISNLCRRSALTFNIIYNQRIKNPLNDKIDRLQVFAIDFSKEPSISEGKTVDLEDLSTVA